MRGVVYQYTIGKKQARQSRAIINQFYISVTTIPLDVRFVN